MNDDAIDEMLKNRNRKNLIREALDMAVKNPYEDTFTSNFDGSTLSSKAREDLTDGFRKLRGANNPVAFDLPENHILDAVRTMASASELLPLAGQKKKENGEESPSIKERYQDDNRAGAFE